MTLNASGPISLGGSTAGESVNLELGQSATATISFNDSVVRTLTGTNAGTTLSMPDGFWGKGAQTSLTISSNQTDLNLRVWALFNGWDGSSKVEITVAPGVYVYSTTTTTPGMTIDGSWPGGVTLINSGYIMGKGGKGGGYLQGPGNSGGTAISINTNCTITNNSYIGGGGGGGGGQPTSTIIGGGGGAGGGDGGAAANNAGSGAGGAVGASGSNGGQVGNPPGVSTGGGGGGGRILPGTGGGGGGGIGSAFGSGGGAGGGGGGFNYMNQQLQALGGNGGSAGGSGANGQSGGSAGGGGGGWGASGGSSGGGQVGGVGGKAIALNGYSATINGSGTTYGAVS